MEIFSARTLTHVIFNTTNVEKRITLTELRDELTLEQSRQGQEKIKPFLTKFSEHPSKFFSGEPVDPASANRRDNDYLYHVTTLGNLRGILDQGLQASHGGVGGAGQRIAEPVNPGAAKNFIAGSRGFVHAAEVPAIVDRYAHEYDNQADAGALINAPVVLRFPRAVLGSVHERDPAERPGAVRTHRDISSNHLELLSQEGWVPLNNRAVVDEIRPVLDQIAAAAPRESVKTSPADARGASAKVPPGPAPIKKSDGPSKG
jgi:hypothetical protein